MIYILYSDDYEVYLGGNYHPEHDVLIAMTDRVLSACEDIGIPINLFADVLCMWRYRELGHDAFPDSAEEQLRRAAANGHGVQAHLHPHWLGTEIRWDGNGHPKYAFDPGRFLLSHWVAAGGMALRQFCADLFRRAKSYLEELLHPVDPSYRCVAFRAGGYGIQPGTTEIFGALLDAGYLIDSSVVPGMVLDSNVNRIDFSRVPREGNYRVSPEAGIDRASEEGIFEIPILALRRGEARRLLASAFLRKVIRWIGRRTRPAALGYTIQSTDGAKPLTVRDRLRAHLAVIRSGWFMLELCPDVGVMVAAARRYIDRYHRPDHGNLYFALSCHSKSCDEHLLTALASFHRRLKRIYGGQLQAITFREAARHLTTGQRVAE